MKDITGEKFGKLTVVKPIGFYQNKSVKWECLCDCGGTYISNSYRLKNNTATHCGCNSTKLKLQAGEKYEMLTVIRPLSLQEKKQKGYKNTGGFYLCKCDCGKDVIILASRLKNKRSKSCGCIKLNLEANLNQLYNEYFYRTRKNKIEFTLTKYEFKDIVTQNCFYCDELPNQITGDRHGEKIIHHGIDRIDSSIGYTIENSRPCCEQCNRMKLDYTEKEFLTKVKKIYLKMKL